MKNDELDALLTAAESPEIAEQIPAIDQLASLVEAIGCRMVGAFVHGQNRFFVAERLNRFGRCIIKPLTEAVQQTTDDEVRILGSIVLLQFGSHVGVPYLLNGIANTSEYICIIAYALVNARVPSALAAIEDRLRRMEYTTKIDRDTVICLLLAHAKMGSALPSDLISRFTAEGVHWEIRTAITKTG